jgi:acyl-CoA thioester hydrolase
MLTVDRDSRPCDCWVSTEGNTPVIAPPATGDRNLVHGPPPTVHGFAAHFRVRNHEMDVLGHVNNAVYLNYLEQAGIEHSAALGYDAARLRAIGGLFIARRHEIDYLRPAVAGDRLIVVTWIAEQRGAQAVREYLLARLDQPDHSEGGLPADHFLAPGFALPDAPLVRARTHWVWVGADDGRPRRLPAEVRATFQRPELPG